MLNCKAIVSLAAFAALCATAIAASAAKPDWGTAGEEKPAPSSEVKDAHDRYAAPRGKPAAPGKPSWGEGPARRVVLPPPPGAGPAGMALLKLYWSEQRRDYLTIATDAGAAQAQGAGYELVGWVGYVFTEARPPCTAPLKLYWHPQQQDHATVVAGAEEAALLKAGYQPVRIEGHVLNLGAADCARAAALGKQLKDLAGARPLVELKLYRRGNDRLTTSDSFKGRMGPEHALRYFSLVGKTGAVYGFPAAPSAQAAGGAGAPGDIGSALEQAGQSPATKEYPTVFVCSNAPPRAKYQGVQHDDVAYCIVVTDIPVRAGSRVELRAEGKVNFGGGVLVVPVPGTRVGAPELDADGDHWQAPQDYPAPALRKNSLIAIVGKPVIRDDGVVIGYKTPVGATYYQGGVNRSFTVKEDGVLVFRPNDRNLSDNSGVYDQSSNSRGWRVQVKVTEPALSGAGASVSGPYSMCHQDTRYCGAPRVPTGVRVSSGSRVEIVTTGKINFGGAVLGMGAPELDADGDHWQAPPDYPAPGLRKNSLVVYVGSKYYQGGTRTSFTPDEDGEIVLVQNDKILGDNQGILDRGTGKYGWQVTVTVTPPARR